MGLEFAEKGNVTVDPDLCAGCGECVTICPERLLSLEDGRARPGAGQFMGCIACGHCMAVCPTGAVSVRGRGLDPADRMDLPGTGLRATAEQLEALLVSRRSVRIFGERDVDREVLVRIVEMTSTAPVGIPPHEVGVVIFHGREKVRAFAEEAGVRFARTAKLFNPLVLALLRPFVGKAQHAVLRDFVRPLLRMIVEERARGRDVFAYDAPAGLLFHHSPFADPADGVIAASYSMLAAESLGLGSCLLGTTVALGRHRDFKDRYGIPREHRIGLGLVLGYPAVEFRGGIRRRLASVRFA